MFRKVNNFILSLLSVSWMLLLSLLDNLELISKNANVYAPYIILSIFLLIQIIATVVQLKICLPGYSKANLIGAKEIENLDGEFLPTYLAYFFVALGLNSLFIAVLLFIIVVVFVSFTRVQYYNPLFLIFGYHFYRIRTERGVSIFLISKTIIRINEKRDFENLRRINNFVYFDMEEA